MGVPGHPGLYKGTMSLKRKTKSRFDLDENSIKSRLTNIKIL